MRIVPVAYFHADTTVKGVNLNFPARSVAIPPINHEVKEIREKWFNSPQIEITDIDRLFTIYDHPEHAKTKKILFTHIGGGIGDIIAFSSIAEFLRNKTIIVHVDPRHNEIFRWFSNQDIRLKTFYEVIMNDFTAANRMGRYFTYARLRMEYAAVEAGAENWYKSMFSRIGINVPDGFDRPHLVRRTDIMPTIPKKSVLISHRSSCQMRSSSFEDFYWPVKNAMPDIQIYVHDVDLSDEDRKFVSTLDQPIKVLSKSTITQYLDNLSNAGMVVCTDTSAIHFREGIGKHCLAVFGAMTTQSRTSGYKYTRSFNVKSECEHQPCFIHEIKKGMLCHKAEPGMITAPCQSGESFQQQLYQELKAYK